MAKKNRTPKTSFHDTLAEYQLVQDIAREYDLQANHMEKYGSAYRVITSQGPKKIKMFTKTKPELEFVYSVLEHLVQKGWKRALPFHLTGEGVPYVELPQGLFYLSEWVEGKEIDPEDPAQLEMAARLMGEMHRLLQDYAGKVVPERCQLPDWLAIYRDRAEAIEQFLQQAEAAKKRDRFSHKFRRIADDFIRLAARSLELLEEADYKQIAEEPEYTTVCHGSYIASNLIMGEDSRVYVIDFDNARRDLRISDLGRLIARHSGWDIDKALFLIENYQAANPLTAAELDLLPALCCFPRKGWAVANSFYRHGREHKHGLEKAAGDLPAQEAFVRQLQELDIKDLVHIPQRLYQTIPVKDIVLPVKEAGQGPGDAATSGKIMESAAEVIGNEAAGVGESRTAGDSMSEAGEVHSRLAPVKAGSRPAGGATGRRPVTERKGAGEGCIEEGLYWGYDGDEIASVDHLTGDNTMEPLEEVGKVAGEREEMVTIAKADARAGASSTMEHENRHLPASIAQAGKRREAQVEEYSPVSEEIPVYSVFGVDQELEDGQEQEVPVEVRKDRAIDQEGKAVCGPEVPVEEKGSWAREEEVTATAGGQEVSVKMGVIPDEEQEGGAGTTGREVPVEGGLDTLREYEVLAGAGTEEIAVEMGTILPEAKSTAAQAQPAASPASQAEVKQEAGVEQEAEAGSAATEPVTVRVEETEVREQEMPPRQETLLRKKEEAEEAAEVTVLAREETAEVEVRKVEEETSLTGREAQEEMLVSGRELPEEEVPVGGGEQPVAAEAVSEPEREAPEAEEELVAQQTRESITPVETTEDTSRRIRIAPELKPAEKGTLVWRSFPKPLLDRGGRERRRVI